MLIIAIAAILQLFFFSMCNSVDKSSISTDPAIIAKGESFFNKNCSGCHNFRQDGIGPQLSGLTTDVSAEWIQQFITNPQQVILSGDERAAQLIKKYKTVMPSST